MIVGLKRRKRLHSSIPEPNLFWYKSMNHTLTTIDEMKYSILTLVIAVTSVQSVHANKVTAIDKDIICTLSNVGVGLDRITEYGFFHMLNLQDVNSTSLSCGVYATTAMNMIVATTPAPTTKTTTTTTTPTTTTTTTTTTTPTTTPTTTTTTTPTTTTTTTPTTTTTTTPTTTPTTTTTTTTTTKKLTTTTTTKNPTTVPTPGCIFTTGDGIGGSEMNIGIKPNAAECFKACVEKKKTISSINGVTISSGSPVNIKCYCEKGMTGNNGNNVWKTCKLLTTVPTPGCTFTIGDGIGGSEMYIGIKPNAAECFKACAEKKKTISSINGVTISSGSPVNIKCYCEKGMTGNNGNNVWKTCKLPTTGCIVDGKTYKVGEKYNRNGDLCTSCDCTLSGPQCKSYGCVKPKCANPILKKGTCCDYKCPVLSAGPNLKRYNKLKGKTIALKSFHNRYVVAESNGRANANRGGIGPWEKFKVELLGNFKIALKSFHNKYLVSESSGGANANRVIRGPWEIFTIEFVDDKRVAFKSYFNKYLVAESNGRLNANRDVRGPWEIFTLEIIPSDLNLQRYNRLKGKTIALKSFHNRYVVAESNGRANANRGGIGPWEEFKVELLGNFKIALKSFHNKYLVSESSGGANANRVIRGPWEIFTIEFVENKRVAFKSHFNKYLVAESNGQLNANRGVRGPWEIFTLEIIPSDPNLQRYNRLKGKTITLKSFHNRYVVAESNGRANANRGGIGPWEKFKVELLGNFKIALKSFHNKYLVSEWFGGANANRVRRGPWEIFTIEFVDDKRVAFKSHFNKYLVAESNGQLNANRGARGPWEIFTLEIV